MPGKDQFPPPRSYVRVERTEREDFENHIRGQVYNALYSAGDLCRIMCQEHPDLLDHIAKAIDSFLSDGDVFNQVATSLLNSDPIYWRHRIAELDEDTARQIVEGILE